MQIIVLGMHRSGTSLTTRLINMMGAYFGPETSVGEITDDNPKGFWERPEVFKLNEALLASQSCAWHDLARWNNQSAVIPGNIAKNIQKIVLGIDAFRPWVLKDPRLCVLLPLWRPYLEVPIAVIVHRDPVEIALSLQRRDGFSLDKGLALWECYAKGIIAHTQDIPRIFVSHHELLERPVETCQRLYQELAELGVRRLAMPSDREITAFIDPKLYRSKPKGEMQLMTENQQILADMMEGKRPFSMALPG